MFKINAIVNVVRVFARNSEFRLTNMMSGFANKAVSALSANSLRVVSGALLSIMITETENPRGLLCTRCNVGLGSFNDDVNLLRRALRYLESCEDE
jgi:hypothetical protein